MQTPEPYPADAGQEAPRRGQPSPRPLDGVWSVGGRLTWIAALVLAVSSFTGWYAGSSGEAGGLTFSVIGWHTGALGKLVFFAGLAVLALVALREAGIDLPATVPESLVVIGLGALATIFVLVRLISIPEEFLPVDGRGVGIWISLISAVALIVAGLLQASEEL